MSYNPRNDKTISDEISKKDERSNNEYNIIIPLRLLISEATQRIFPYPPPSYHTFYNLSFNGVINSTFIGSANISASL